MYCSTCGQEVADQALACWKCGAALLRPEAVRSDALSIVPVAPRAAMPSKPGKIIAIAVMDIISGFTNFGYGFVLLFSCYFTLLAPLPMTLGVFEILNAIKLLKDPTSARSLSKPLAICQICMIMGCNLHSAATGVISLLFADDPEVKEYFGNLDAFPVIMQKQS